MKCFRVVWTCVWMMGLGVAAGWADDVPESPTPQDVLDLLDEIESRFVSMNSLSYQVDCVSQGEQQTMTERWRFIYQAPGYIRLDYQVPDARLIIVNPSEMWEYLPQAGAARRTNLARLSPKAQMDTLRQVLARVEVDGLRPGRLTVRAKDFKGVTRPSANPALWRIDGGKPRICFEVDPVQQTVRKTEVYDKKGNLLLRTEASDFVEAEEGWFLPRQIRCTYGAKDVFVSRRFTLSDIKVNAPLDASLFTFDPPARIQVMGDIP